MARKRKPVYQGWAWGLLNTKAHYYASDVGKFLCGVDMDWVLSEELLERRDRPARSSGSRPASR